MFWLIYLLIGLFIWSIAGLVDRYALHDKKVKSEKLYLIFPCVTLVIAAAIVIIPFFGLEPISSTSLWLALAAGIVEAFGLYYYYVAVSKEEISKVASIGMLTSFFTLFLAWFVLKDPLSKNELIAFLFFVIGSIILACHYEKGLKISKAVKPLIIGGLFGSVKYILFKAVFNVTEFWTGLFYSTVGLFIGGLLFILIWHKEMWRDFKILTPKMKTLMFGNQAFAFFGHIFFFYSINLTNPALVSAAAGIQPVMILIMAIIVTKINPNLIAENIKKEDLVKKAVGIVIICLAVYVLNIN